MGTGRLRGKVAIITGAAGGIGAAGARQLASEGAQLLLTDADEQGAQLVAAGLGDGATAGQIDTDGGTTA
jgi:NAD(P)-dependent dehydrogenase (short-subunit alcohol dehydrogenase family)